MIGHGGFGITYRAFDTQLAKVVAIKEYLPLECAIRHSDGAVVPRGARLIEDFTWGRERFLDEARALGALPPSPYRAGAALLRGQRHGLYGDGVRGRQDRRRAPARTRPPPAGRRCPAPGHGLAERPRRRACPGLSSSRHQAGEHHHPARRRARSRRFRRGAPGDGRPYAHAHQRAHAAICADRAICPRRQAGRRGATSIPPPPSSITRSRDRRRPTRPRGSARIPIGRWPRSRAIASSRRSWPRSTTRWPSRRTTGRKASGVEQRCLAPRCPRSRMRRRNALPTAPASRRRAWAAPAAKVRACLGAAAALELRVRCRSRWIVVVVVGGGVVALPAGDPHAVAIYRRLATRSIRRPRPRPSCQPPLEPATQPQASPTTPAQAGKGDHRSGAAGRRRRASGTRARRGSSGHRACGGGRGAYRGGAGRPAGPRARGAPVVRSGRELCRPACRRQASGSRRRRSRQWRAPGGCLAGRPIDRPWHGAARRQQRATPANGTTVNRPALACARSRASTGPKAILSWAGSKGRGCGARWPTPLWFDPATSVRCPGGARRRTDRGASATKAAFAAARERLRPGDGGGRQGHGRSLGSGKARKSAP